MRNLALVAVYLLLTWTPRASGQQLPPASAPGAIDSRVTQANLATTVCVPNYTATVRPPVTWTNKLKRTLFAQFKLAGDINAYELDHRVPIEEGGAAQDARNLWMQPWPEARLKDRLETRIHRDICAGRISLADAEKIFLGDWWLAYDRYATAAGWPARK